ncbi:MAG: hypothetical protein ACHQAX_08460 [Gammaproteobacteria bacterium]
MPLTQTLVNDVIEQLKPITPINTEQTHAKAYLLGLLKDFNETANNDELEKKIHLFALTRKIHTILSHPDLLISKLCETLENNIKSYHKLTAKEELESGVYTIKSICDQLFSFLDANKKNDDEQAPPDFELNWYKNDSVLGLIKQIQENDLQSAYNQDQLLITAAMQNWTKVVIWLLDKNGGFSINVLKRAAEKAAEQCERRTAVRACYGETYDETIAVLLKKLGKGNYTDAVEIGGYCRPLLFATRLFGWPQVLRVLKDDGLVPVAESPLANISRIEDIVCQTYPMYHDDRTKVQLISILLEAGVSIANEPMLLSKAIKHMAPGVLALLIKNNIDLNGHSDDKKLYEIADVNKWEDVKKALVERKDPAAMVAMQKNEVVASTQQHATPVSGAALMRLSQSTAKGIGKAACVNGHSIQ